MKKALIVATTTSFITDFELSDIGILQDFGYEVHSASNVNINNRSDSYNRLNAIGVVQHQIDFSRSPFSLSNLIAYKQLKRLLKEEHFDLIHCHTPVGGFLARLSARKKKEIKMIYTAHGFHFFKGNSPIKNCIFHTVEKFCAKYTDALITINNEDYEAAQKFKLRNSGKLYKINGVGINTDKFAAVDIDIAKKRTELGISQDDIMLLSVGELIERKNHIVVINALKNIDNPRLHYFIAGCGILEENFLKKIQEFNLADRVHLLGYRTDISELCACADVFVFPSFQEGLSVALMEAMACGLPVIASKIRGNVDLIEEGKGGILVSPFRTEEFKDAIMRLSNDNSLWEEYGAHNKEAIKKFDIKVIKTIMEEIYKG